MPGVRRRADRRTSVWSAGFLHAEPEDEGPHALGGLFPGLTEELWREAVFCLAWKSHGGSGLEISWSEVLDLKPAERDWLLKRVSDQRCREADAIRNARR